LAGAVGVSARTLSVPDSAWRLVLELSLWAIVLNGLAAAVAFAMALQTGGATAVTAIMFTTNTVLSSAIGFVLAITGAIRTAHHASLAHPGE
jgi:uncharacterized membrane protein